MSPDPRLARSRWEPYAEDVALGCLSRRPREDTALVIAIGLRETWMAGRDCPGFVIPYGLPDYMGSGDGGHGRGIFQIDDRSWTALLPRPDEDWRPFIQAGCACVVLAEARRSLSAWRPRLGDWHWNQAVCAAYNAGAGSVAHFLNLAQDPDRGTTGADYGRDVLRLRDGLRQLYPATFPPVAATDPLPVA